MAEARTEEALGQLAQEGNANRPRRWTSTSRRPRRSAQPWPSRASSASSRRRRTTRRSDEDHLTRDATQGPTLTGFCSREFVTAHSRNLSTVQAVSGWGALLGLTVHCAAAIG